MYEKIRSISVFILIALFFAPLGSCAIKTRQDESSIRTTVHAISKLSSEELQDAEIRSFKICETKIRGLDIKGSGGILYLLSLIGSFLLSKAKKVSRLANLINALAVITFIVIYIACASFAYAAHTTTIYGWTFILVGFLHVWSCVPCLVPKKIKSS